MAVEARHLNFCFPSQHVINSAIDGNGSMYNAQFYYGSVPISGTTTTAETLLPMYNNNSSVIVDSFVKNHQRHQLSTTTTPMKDNESGISYALPPVAVSRKRPRDACVVIPTSGYSKNFIRCGNNDSLSFLGEDISSQFLAQQLDVDSLISQHMEKVRLEIEEIRKRHSIRVIEAVEVGMIKRLRAKEEEIERIVKLNWALEERVKSLYIENQLWREHAQLNEATANELRNNLELVLAQVSDIRTNGDAGLNNAAALNDDAESCCGSSGGSCEEDGKDDDVQGGWRTLDVRGGKRKVVTTTTTTATTSNNNLNSKGNNNHFGWCRKCGKEEACVLLLPCRHLCLCTFCGSSHHTCPICKSNHTASVHVNLS